MAKLESYSSGTQSPSNSSEDGNTSFHIKKPGRKTDRQRVESGQRREWSDSEIVRLIQLWKENDILYNTNHPLYYVQTERKVAMDAISNVLQIPVKDVNDKMHSLRTYYCSQRQRLGNIMQCRGEAMKNFSRWKFYDQMSFLYESVTNRAFKSSLSGKSRRKRESPRSDTIPYMNMRDELLKPRSSARLYDPDAYSLTYPERSSSREPNEKETSDVHSSLDEHLDRRRLTGVNNNQFNEINNIGSPSWESSNERENSKLNPSDEMFGHMVASSLSQIEDEQEKELLKLNLQTMIYNVRFKKETSFTNLGYT